MLGTVAIGVFWQASVLRIADGKGHGTMWRPLPVTSFYNWLALLNLISKSWPIANVLFKPFSNYVTSEMEKCADAADTSVLFSFLSCANFLAVYSQTG